MLIAIPRGISLKYARLIQSIKTDSWTDPTLIKTICMVLFISLITLQLCVMKVQYKHYQANISGFYAQRLTDMSFVWQLHNQRWTLLLYVNCNPRLSENGRQIISSLCRAFWSSTWITNFTIKQKNLGMICCLLFLWHLNTK